MSAPTSSTSRTTDPPKMPNSRAGDLNQALTRQAVLIAAVCLFADSFDFLFSGPISDLRPQDWAVFAAIAAVDAALALPARYSGWVAAAYAVIQIVAAAVTEGSPIEHGGSAGFVIAGFRAGAWLTGVSAWAALAVLVLSTVCVSLISGNPSGYVAIAEAASSALLPWLVGRYTTARRGYIAELELEAENQRRDARAAVDNAVREERSTIARDLHDVISHHVSAIGAHAGAARLRLTADARPLDVSDSMAAVETSSRAAMVDLRRLLDLLHGDSAGIDQPGLENIEELLNAARRAGMPIQFTSRGVARPVPDSVQMALYRITQEMLTNARRHGDGGAVEVELRHSETTVAVTTRNGVNPVEERSDSGDAAPHPTSRGLAGMRSRAAVFGGDIAYGPSPDGHRWETTIVFPVEDRR